MKNIKLLTVSILILSCASLHAQSKWFAAPLVGIASIDGNFGYTANLTLGRYISDFGVKEKSYFRADICSGYFGFSKNRIYSAAALFSACGSSEKWYNSASMGFGVQKSENRSKYDFIIPLRMIYGAYRFNNKMCLGLDLSANLNLSDFWSGTPVYLGLFLGIGL